MPPKWFWAVLALCLLALTASIASRLRWQHVNQSMMLDSWRKRICVPGACFPLELESGAGSTGSPRYDPDTAKAFMDTAPTPR